MILLIFPIDFFVRSTYNAYDMENAFGGRVSVFGISERKQAAENASYGGYGEVHPTAHRGNLQYLCAYNLR